MIRAARFYDVFISSSLEDMALGTSVADQLSNAGYTVFFDRHLASGSEFPGGLWEALGESSAFVLVLSRPFVASNIGVELGAAMAWSKPIFIVRPSTATSSLPEFLQRYRIFSSDNLEELADAIGKSHQELTDEQRDLLRNQYAAMGVPADHLSANPALLARLAQAFNKAARTSYSAERLMQEILRMRKVGKLPRVRKARR